MSQTMISLVMPFREPHQFLSAAVQSAIEDVDGLGEVILVVDGPRPAQPIPFEGHPHVRVIVLGNHSGTPAALNAGIYASQAEYIARLDSDDIVLPGRALQLSAILNRDSSLVGVGTQAVLIDENDQELGRLAMPQAADEIRAVLPRKNALIHSSVLYRRGAALAIGGYDEACFRMQDYDFFLRLATIGDLANSDDALIKYRVHSSMSSTLTSPYAPYTRTVLRSRYALARANGDGRIVSGSRNAAWWAAQAARHHGLRKPRYLTEVPNHA